MSATVLIAVAVVAFVVLVSVQALENWPLAGSPNGPGAAEQSAATLTARQVRAARAARHAAARSARRGGRGRTHHRSRAGVGVTSGSAGRGPAVGSTPQLTSGGAGQAEEQTPSAGAAPAQTSGQPAPVEKATGTVAGVLPEAESTVSQTGLTQAAEPVLQEAAPATATANGAVGKVTETTSGLTTGLGH